MKSIRNWPRCLLVSSFLVVVPFVFGAPLCTPTPSGLVAWWPAEGNANDIIGGNNGIATAITYTNGEVGQAFVFDGTSGYVLVPGSSNLDIGDNGSGITIEGWINPASDADGPIAEWASGFPCALGLQLWCQPGLQLVANVIETNGNYHALYTGTGALSSNIFQHVALTYDKASGNAVLYINGVPVISTNFWDDHTADRAGILFDYWQVAQLLGRQ